MSRRKIAIIGSNGFIGSNLVKLLETDAQNELYLFGRSEKSVHGDSHPYSRTLLSDKEAVAEAFKDIETIYFLASETIPATSWGDPVQEVTGNLLPFVVFLETVSTLSAKKVVFVSSGGTVYGPTTDAAREEDAKSPFSPYGIMKLTMEYFLHYFFVRTGLQYDIYRVSNVYGTGQDTSKGLGIINTFLENIARHKRIEIFGDGHNVRNYVYIDDLVKILALSLEPGGEACNVVNCASNDTLSINDLVAIIQRVVEEEFEIVRTPNRSSDNSIIMLDNSKLLSQHPELTFTPLVEGIRKTYAVIRDRQTVTA